MTAYGRSSFEAPYGQFSIEIHSVNRKTLEFSMHLPREFLLFDLEIRKMISKKIGRGQVTVRIARELKEKQLPMPKLSLLKTLKQSWEEVAIGLEYDPKSEISLNFLSEQLRTMPTLSIEDTEGFKKKLEVGLNAALEPFLKMRQVEGNALLQGISGYLEIIETETKKIEKLAKTAPDKYREKLQNRFRELKELDEKDKERIEREILLYSEKLDVTEEIIRLASHLGQFRSQMQENKSVGRSLEFLVQEINREANTIGSKSSEIEITKSVMVIKGELEKIRQQVQNIE